MKALLLLITFEVATTFGQKSKLLLDFAAENQNFAAKVYQEVKKANSGNFLISPLSVQAAISLAHAGAKGETAYQLANAAYLPDDREKIEEIFHELSPVLQVNDTYVLASSSKLYLANRFQIKDKFRNTVVNRFRADIQNINFSHTHQAALEMNKWVKRKTLGKINEIIKEEHLYASTAAVLINAMYFKTTWLEKFAPDLTFVSDFYVNRTHKVNVPMAYVSGRSFRHHELNAQFLELPCERNDVSMTVVLPNKKGGLAALEQRMGDIFLNYPYDKTLPESVISIPKFKIDTIIDLSGILKEFGVHIPFTSEADLRDISDNTIPLHINKIVQTSVIDVNEKGSTTGATAGRGVTHKRRLEHSFTADHPFIFFLRHTAGEVLLVGRYTGPEDLSINEVNVNERIYKSIPVTPDPDWFIWE